MGNTQYQSMKNLKLSIKQISYFIIGCSVAFSILFYVIFPHNEVIIDEIMLILAIAINGLLFYFVRNVILSIASIEVDKSDSNIVELAPYFQKINTLKNEILIATDFIAEIEKGNMDKAYTAIDESKLYSSLLTMRDKMKSIAAEEKQRNWATEGMANFGELLRINNKNIESLGQAVTGKLVQYLEANQGAMFVIRENDAAHKYLEMIACYAYSRKKHIDKIIEIGEGLVGQVVLEKEVIYMTSVPNGYTIITSGLGEATPSCVLIVPLMVNEEVLGVLELCSFHPIKNYQIDFVKKLGESIASTISMVMTNESTQHLLKSTQEQSIQLQNQEEEMRQNLEELHATQEDMMRKEQEIQTLLEKSQESEKLLQLQLVEINNIKEEEKLKTEEMVFNMELNKKVILKVIEELPDKIFLKDEEGKLVLINSSLASGYNKSVSELIGTSDFDNFPNNLATEYRAIELEMLKSGKPMTMYEDFPDASGNNKVLYCVKMPFEFPGTSKIGILGYQVDVTEIKTMESKIAFSEQSMKLREEALQAEILKGNEAIVALNQQITELMNSKN